MIFPPLSGKDPFKSQETLQETLSGSAPVTPPSSSEKLCEIVQATASGTFVCHSQDKGMLAKKLKNPTFLAPTHRIAPLNSKKAAAQIHIHSHYPSHLWVECRIMVLTSFEHYTVINWFLALRDTISPRQQLGCSLNHALFMGECMISIRHFVDYSRDVCLSPSLASTRFCLNLERGRYTVLIQENGGVSTEAIPYAPKEMK